MTIGALGSYGYYNSYAAISPSSSPDATDSASSVRPLPGSKETDPAGKVKETSKDEPGKKPGYESSPQECETCKERKYQDGSNESNVSFKAASHIAPEAAGAKVRAHESEHVHNAYAKAEKGNGQVVSASVAIHTSVCPECGRTYVSGGTTTTAIKYSNESNPYQQARKTQDASVLAGANVDLTA